jgi:hypothetical protein
MTSRIVASALVLAIASTCVAIGVIGFCVARANFPMLPQDPPPPGDPYWQTSGRKRWLDAGCCGGIPIGLLGLVLLPFSFRRDLK